MHRLFNERAFTLIELLIVVAIIAIISAIALPNFRNAQIRSKVARVQAEMQTIALALESYKTDNNTYPTYNNPFDATVEYEHFTPIYLTTPVAYLSSLPFDIFSQSRINNPSPNPLLPYYYFTEDFSPGEVYDRTTTLGIPQPTAQWVIWSYGPDLTDNEATILYDPTNGTLSGGDIIRFGP